VIETLFPPGVVVVRAEPGMQDDPLHPAEASRLPRMSEKRRVEFVLGRACARRALARLGIHDFALRNDADRTPIWPEGVVGSLTHGVTANDTWKNEINTALGLFLTDGDIAAFQTALADAAAQYGN